MNHESVGHLSHQQRGTSTHGMVNATLENNGFGVIEPGDADLESARNLFGERVKELSAAVAKVDALTRQLEELRKGNTSNSYHVGANGNSNCLKFNQEFGKLRHELLCRSRLAHSNQSADLQTKKSLLNRKKSELVVIDEKIAQLQQRLAKKRHINQQLSYQMQSQALAGPVGLSNHFNSLRGTSGHSYKRHTINQRSIGPNIAAVEPIQRKPQYVDQTSEISMNEETFSVLSKHDPKYQTLPPSIKLNKSGPDGLTDKNARMGDKCTRLSPSITRTIDGTPDDAGSPLILSSNESGVGSSISSGCSLQVNNVMTNGKKETEDRIIPNTVSPSIKALDLHGDHPTPYLPSAITPTGDGSSNHPVPTLSPQPSSFITSTPFAPNISKTSNNNDDWQKSRRRPVVVDADMERELSAPDCDNAMELTQKHFPIKTRTDPIIVSLKDPESALANKSASGLKSCCEVKCQNDAEEENDSPPDAFSCDVTDDSGKHIAVAPLQKVVVVEKTIESLSVKQNDTGFEEVEELEEKKSGHKSCKSPSGLIRRVSFDPLALLLDAALEGELELVKKTASQVPDPSAVKDEGITALHNAICAGHLPIVRFLIDIGCDVNAQDSDGWTPLHCAASCNNLPMVRLLVQNGACIFATTFSDHETAAEKCEEDEAGYDECYRYLSGVQDEMGVSNEGGVYAVYEYDAQNCDEMSFKEGDQVTIIRRGDDQEINWWWARAANGKEGYVPRNLFGLFPRVKPKKGTDDRVN